MSVLVGNKLYEGSRVAKLGQTIESLESIVEFPDVRSLVGRGDLTWSDVLRIRRKAVKFRRWLQQESDRDRDAIIAYHHEVAKESNLLRASRKGLSIFGVLGGAAAGAVLSGPLGAVVGAGGGYLLDLAAKIGSEWKPVVFGNWMKKRIEKILDSE
ncbi:MAG: hypothetical protein ACE5G0_01365 [Rhodothermales bacterium]